MKPYFESRETTVHCGNALQVLRTLPDESVQCCVTSPPYFGLRRYSDSPAEIGIEETPAQYIANLVAVFREVRRVLRNDGTLWLNLGDSYAAQGGAQVVNTINANRSGGSDTQNQGMRRSPVSGLKPKDMMMIPARVAIALQDDGWYLRSEIIWCKKAPMPESVTDRPTSAHEKIYLLSKSPKYFYDADAIKELATEQSSRRANRGNSDHHKNLEVPGRTTHSMHKERARGNGYTPPEKRNAWNYWLLSPENCREAHFATFPTEIPRRAILAGSRVGDTILEPFLGSGTTAMVAQQLGRRCIGIELNPGYLPIIEKRIQADQCRIPLFAPTAPEPAHQTTTILGERP